MTTGALLGRIELVHTLLAAARRLTATESACLCHGGLTHTLSPGSPRLDALARRAAAEGGELVERADGGFAAAVALPGRTGSLAVATAREAEPEPRRIALLGRLASIGGELVAGWPSDRPFWDGLVDVPAATAVSTRAEGMTSLAVGGGRAVELDSRDWLAIRRLEADVVDAAAHELRSPLTALRAHAEILPDLLSDDDGPARGFLGVIESEAARMGELLDELRAALTFETTVVVHG